ncbi:MAG: LURP-one-related family protein [Acidobacteria bacterium]|nr:LURP-one-related family protein [Acidobacteriota bacterium]
MRYVMKQKFFSLGDSFAIRDEQGQEVFRAQGKVISFGDQLTLRDASGEEVAYISQKVFSWGPTYEIYRGGQLFAVVKKKMFTFFKHIFTVDVPGPDDLVAEGDFWELEFAFSRGGQTVAVVSRQWFSWADTYGVDVAEGEDDVLILASTIVIDMVRADSRRHSS